MDGPEAPQAAAAVEPSTPPVIRELSQVEVGTAWPQEAGSGGFTEWLADNLHVLARLLGFGELARIGTEVGVGGTGSTSSPRMTRR